MYFVCGSIWTIRVCLSSNGGTPDRMRQITGVVQPSLRRQCRSDRCLQAKTAQKVLSSDTEHETEGPNLNEWAILTPESGLAGGVVVQLTYV